MDVTEGVTVGDCELVSLGVCVGEGEIEGDVPLERVGVGVCVSDGVTDGDSEGVVVFELVGDCPIVGVWLGVPDGPATVVAVAVKPAGEEDAVETLKGEGCGKPSARKLPSRHEQPTVRLRSATAKPTWLPHVVHGPVCCAEHTRGLAGGSVQSMPLKPVGHTHTPSMHMPPL